MVNTVSASVGIAWDDDGLWRRFSERDTFGPRPLRGRGRGPDRGTALKAFVRQGHRKNGCHQQSAGTGSAIGDRNTQQQSLVDIIVFRP